MDRVAVGDVRESTSAFIPRVLTLLLNDPPSPASTLSSTVRYIEENAPFTNIDPRLLQKWTSRISSLIQSKSHPSRYWGISLAKATLKSGGEGVNHAVTWTKLLLGLLNRPESPVLLEQAIETLTVCFQLISTRPTLSRDLNALLPTFFGALLELLKQPGLQPAVLKSWHTLIPDHGTTLRPYSNRMKDTPISQYLSATTENIQSYAKAIVDEHHSAAKGSNSQSWTAALSQRLSLIQMSLSAIFEPIHEDETRSYPRAAASGVYSEQYMSEIGTLQMSLIFIKEFLRLPTKQPVNIPLGEVVQIAMRVYRVTPQARIREQAFQAEASLLFSNLGTLYAYMNDLLITVVKCVGKSFMPHFRSVFNELLFLLSTNRIGNPTFHTSSYDLLFQLIHEFGAGLHFSKEATQLDNLVKLVLHDISSLSSSSTLPSLSVGTSRKRKLNGTEAAIPSSTALPSSQIISAIHLVTEIIRLTPLLSLSSRSSIDEVILSTALDSNFSPEILSKLHQAIVTSVQFPAGPSIIPHALRIFERDSASRLEVVRTSAVSGLRELEILIHPRLPPQKVPKYSEEDKDEEQQEDEEMEVLDQDVQSDVLVVKEELEQTVVEQTVVKPAPVDGRLSQQVEIPSSAQPHSNVEVAPRSLPSFVTTASSNIPISDTPTANISLQKSKPETTSTSAAIESKQLEDSRISRDDVFTKGAWKDPKAEEDKDEDEPIPEIDMELSSEDDDEHND